METIKLYKKQHDTLYYWQAWSRTLKAGVINQGIVGEVGPKEVIRAKNKTEFEVLIQERINAARQEGFSEATTEDILVIEYEAENMTANKLKKLHRLGDHLDYLVGYTGLGAFDGNGYGFGKMDVSVTVVNFEIAKRVIAADLADTIFGNYLSINKVDLEETDED
ncbi:hypothetical protein ACFST9_04025 [Hymenobacter monticola]|uniref:WGR domain-containing protein n=1 Tax=Hymenobacter monticola TaxID=1705399 RepID=A0ABY4B247_9BACT|nr:hypothetical protein [Hymenobacter monticola]UOE32879.1 hypothetical protein MTP16_17295 [Hymenobacter monticola]